MKHLFLISCSILLLANCSEISSTSSASEGDQEWIEQGQRIAAATFATLSQQLQHALKEGGVPNAVQYCNLAAYPLTDSLANAHDAHIRRATLKARNPQNRATAEEELVIQQYATAMEKGEVIKPMLKHSDEEEFSFYAPIVVGELCLKCHGELGETLTAENYAHILKTYPEDQAIAYKSGELRGVWHIKLASP
jgi:hypothetical protein